METQIVVGKRKRQQWIHPSVESGSVDHRQPGSEQYRIEEAQHFSQHQVEHISMHVLDLWKDLFVSRDEGGDTAVDINLKSHSYFPIKPSIPIDNMKVANNSSSANTSTNSTKSSSTNSVDAVLGKITTAASRSSYELTNLWWMSKMLLSAKDLDQGLKTYPRSASVASGIVPTIPVESRIRYKQKIFGDALNIMSRTFQQTEQVLHSRQELSREIEQLGQFWRLSSPTGDPFRNFPQATSMAMSVPGEYVSIDCSYVTFGDHPLSIFEYLVPLVTDSQGHLRLHSVELSRKLFTLSLSLTHRDPMVGSLGSINAWQISKADIQAANPSPDPSSYLDIIHQHCLKRKHEAFCCRLFSLLRTQAMARCDRWTVSPAQKTGDDASLHVTDCYHQRTINFNELFMNQVFSSALNITALESGQLRVALSSDINLTISLVPILGDLETEPNPNDEGLLDLMDLQNNDSSATSWTEDILSKALQQGKALLFQYFKSEFEKSCKEKQVKINDAAHAELIKKATPAAAAASVLKRKLSVFQPLAPGDHTRIDQPLRQIGVDLGDNPDMQQQQQLAHEKENILRAMINSMKVHFFRHLLQATMDKYQEEINNGWISVDGWSSGGSTSSETRIHFKRQQVILTLVLSSRGVHVSSRHNEPNSHSSVMVPRETSLTVADVTHPMNIMFHSFLEVHRFLQKQLEYLCLLHSLDEMNK